MSVTDERIDMEDPKVKAEIRDIMRLPDGKEAARKLDEYGINYYKWYSPEDPMRNIMDGGFERGYKRMASLMELSFNGWEYFEKEEENPRSQAEILVWTANFNATQCELAKEHNEKILEDERNESA